MSTRAPRGSRKQITTAGNNRTIVVTLRSIMASRAFGAGYRDALQRKQWAGDAYPQHEAWSYERGRQFAALYSGPLKDGRHVLPPAYLALREAMRRRDIL